LVLSGGTLYGTAEPDGRGGSGTIFAIDTNGAGFNKPPEWGSRSSIHGHHHWRDQR